MLDSLLVQNLCTRLSALEHVEKCVTESMTSCSFYDDIMTIDEQRSCEKHISVLKILLQTIPQHFPKQPQPFGKF